MQKPARKIKPRLLIGVAAAILLIGAAVVIYLPKHPCWPVFRAFSDVSCPQSVITFSDFRPIDGQAVSPPTKVGDASIYGWSYSADGEVHPARIRFNIETGNEINRDQIPYLNGNRWYMGFSKDGERAIITCFGSETCSTVGWKRAIIQVNGYGQPVPMDTPITANDPLRFPGEPQPVAALSEAARFAADGRRIVFIDTDGDVWLQHADGESITVLFDEPRPRRGFAFLNALSISPSGNYVALVNASRRRPSLLVWETANGSMVARLDLPPQNYAIDIDPIWSPDESRIGIIRSGSDAAASRETVLELYSWR